MKRDKTKDILKNMKMNRRKCVIAIASCLVSMFDVCITITFGTMFLHLLDKYRESRAATASVHSLFLGTATCFSVVSGILIRKQGVTRVSIVGTVLLSGGFTISYFATSILMLNILICVISGIGVSLLLISSTVVLGNNFAGRKREIALSVQQMFMGIGAMLYPLLLKQLLYEYGVNGTFLILGGLYLNNSVFVVLTYTKTSMLKNQPQSMVGVLERKQRVTNKPADIKDRRRSVVVTLSIKLWKQIIMLIDFRYTVVLVASGLVIASVNSYLSVFEDIFTWKEFTSSQILQLFTTFYSSGIVGRALPVAFSMAKPGNDMMLLLIFCSISGCFGQLLLLFSSSLKVAFAANVFSGLTHGCILSATTVSIANIATKELFSVAFGLFLAVDGILSVAGGPLYGFIRDSVKSYELAIVSTAVLNGLSALLFSTAALKRVCESRKISTSFQAAGADK